MSAVGLSHTQFERTLRESRLVSDEELQRGVDAPVATEHESLADRLVRLGIIDEETLRKVVAIQNGRSMVTAARGRSVASPQASPITNRPAGMRANVIDKPLSRVTVCEPAVAGLPTEPPG